MCRYECIERDRRINPYFEGSKLSSIKKAQSAYITMVLGGARLDAGYADSIGRAGRVQGSRP